jgi:hypothetical protein
VGLGIVSRTRLIRPEFFADELMAQLSVTTRLMYIGLWTLCDDAGYLELEPRQIAAELLRYEGPAKRDRAIAQALDDLVAKKRVKLLECGEHAVIPTIPDHRIKGGEALFTIKKRHERRCLSSPTEPYVGLHSPADSVGLRRTTSGYIPVSDSESGSVSTSAQARDGKKLANAAAEAGGFVARLAARRNGKTTPTPVEEPVEDPAWMATPGGKR